MIALMILLSISIFPSPFLIWIKYKEYVINKITKKALISWMITSLFPVFNHVNLLIEWLSYSKWDDEFLEEMELLNSAYKCNECDITSRKYQYKGIYKNKCPQCNHSNSLIWSMDREKEYPFAPKLTTFSFIKWKNEENKINSINTELKNTELIDKELESYEKLQLKKLKELEEKANKIKAEMKLKEEYHV